MTLEEAERSIVAILRELESDTDRLVDEIIISDVDITRLDDLCQNIMRTVSISFHRVPGQDWYPR